MMDSVGEPGRKRGHHCADGTDQQAEDLRGTEAEGATQTPGKSAQSTGL